MKDSKATGDTPGGTANSNSSSKTPSVPEPDTHLGHLRPTAAAVATGFPVGKELLLLPNEGERVFALNESGRAIWELCDGKHSLEQIIGQLQQRFDGPDIEISADLTAALFQFHALNLLEPGSLTSVEDSDSAAIVLAPARSARPRVRIVHGIEDRPYFHWQLAVMFESLIGQMPAGWDINVVVCNGHQQISNDLHLILDTYGVRYFTAESLADEHHIDFAGGGDRYVPINRVSALNVISQHVDPTDLVCLMDSDIFLFGDLQQDLFPTGNAMASNWIVGQQRYFQFSTGETTGLSLPRLLEAFGCEAEFKPGGVMVFLTGEALQQNDRKLIKDCYRFLQILYLSGKILEMPERGTWVAEMACFALAMYPNNIDYELLDIEQFAVQEQAADELPQGTFFHYYADFNDSDKGLGPFKDSAWHKQLFGQTNFLMSDLDGFLNNAGGATEKQFMTLAKSAQERLYGNEAD